MVFRNIYKGRMGKAKGGSDQWWEVGVAGRGVGGVGGREMETTVLEQHLKKCGEKKNGKNSSSF